VENPGSKNESLITLITQHDLFNVHPSRSAGACFAAQEGSLLPPPLVEEGAVVAIMAEEKQHALGIGVTTKSTKAVREENKGAARPRNERRRQPRLLTLASLARSTAAWPWPTLRIARAGVAIETTHYLKDGLWMMPTVPS